MVKRIHKKLILALTTLSLISCSWVQLTDAGRGVSVVSSSEVSGCRRLGSANAQSLNKVVGVGRSNEKLQDELSTLARNEAGGMGGNRVVIESALSEGRQSFGVYSCD